MTTSPLTATPAPSTKSGVSRRGFLAGAAAATTAVPVLGSGVWSPASAATLPLVTPVWSETLRRSFGVAVQPQMRDTVYGRVDVWPKYVAQMNAAYIRGKFGMKLPETPSLIAQCRSLGLKWVMSVVPEDWSMSLDQLKTVLAYIRDNAADVCIAIEGMNEPNHNRDGSPVPVTWAKDTVAYQKVIKDFVTATPSMAHVTVVGPSLQMGGTDPLVDFNALRDAGLVPLMHQNGMHSYPAGLKPDNQVDTRLGYVSSAFGPSMRTWVSETGYNNAMNAPLIGPRPVPLDISAAYAPRSVLEYFTRGCNSSRYELLDEPNPTNDDVEMNYGLISCPGEDPATWTPKPEFTTMKNFLGSLKDGAAAYAPAPVALQVTAPAAVKWLAVAKSDGSKWLLAYQNVSIWNAVKRLPVTVTPVDVTVTDNLGSRVVKVAGDVLSIPLR